MGVHGLWRLIEPSGKPVPLETLENKVLAVDISIWLHQAVKGFQDSKGASVPNAHLLGIYHRVCKLLYFRIKPIFVFDGGVPALKKQTIAKRTQSKLRSISAADRIQKQLLTTLLKHSAVSKVLTEKIEASIGSVPKVASRSTKDDMYRLPADNELDSTISSSEDEAYSETTTTDSSPTKDWDLHTIDMDSVHFKSLPVDVRHEILIDLKETRKQSSWGRLHELPNVSDDFSFYQMKRLLKRQAVQAALEEAEQEMGGKSLSLAELESILKEEGIITNQNVGNIIASDETTKYLLVKNVKQALEDARKKEQNSENALREENEVISIDLDEENDKQSPDEEPKSIKTKADMEYEDDLKRAIALSLECEPSTCSRESESTSVLPSEHQPSQEKSNNLNELSFLQNFNDADFASSSSDEEYITKPNKMKMSSAKSYMLEYSGLTPSEIAKIMNTNLVSAESKKLKRARLPTVNENCEEITSTTDISTKVPINGTVPGETVDESVEIMSSTDSNDSEVDDNDQLKEVNIVINPNSEYKEDDDLFADVFTSLAPESGALSSSEIVRSNQTVEQSKIMSDLDVAVSTTDKFDVEDGLILSEKGEKLLVKSDSGTLIMESSNGIPNIGIRESAGLNVNDGKSTAAISTSTSPRNVDVISIEDGDTDRKGGEEHSKFPNEIPEIVVASSVKDSVNSKKPKKQENKIPTKPAMTEQELKQLKDELQKDRVDLLNEKSTKERMAGNITDQMYQEAQDLLELFGVPYIIAPMEAEAQCAFLDAIELTDGTITDDSDIWLFGGKTVYKNFFNQNKYVMEFRSENIHHHFKLTREQMILLALLVGSDYTVGLQGVGPVTAMEILAAFPPSKGKINEFSLSHSDVLSGLKEFRSWFTKGKSPGPGRSALKSKLKNLYFTENFPSLQVVQAYLDPTVETSKDAFSWGKPNALALLEFAREKFGWTKIKTEDILNPVLKKLEESKHQKSIRDYFKSRFRVHSGEAESKMSKRVRSAITNMGRDPSEVLAEELQDELKKQPRKKATRTKKEGGKEAPEFSKARKTRKLPKTSTDNQETNDQTNSDDAKNVKGANKVKLHKLKSTSEHQSDETSNIGKSNQDDNGIELESDEVNEEADVSEKINLIRRRRKIREAKAAIDIKKPKIIKEKKLASQLLENIPTDLEADQEISLLSQIVAQSNQKVEDINKALEERLQSMQAKSVETFGLNTPPSTPKQPQPSTSGHRPAFRPTRIPRKESIPQKDKDKSMLLRNKLKAIEVYRKGKHGPGFVPRRDRKKKLPKTEAELSESSDE